MHGMAPSSAERVKRTPRRPTSWTSWSRCGTGGSPTPWRRWWRRGLHLRQSGRQGADRRATARCSPAGSAAAARSHGPPRRAGVPRRGRAPGWSPRSRRRGARHGDALRRHHARLRRAGAATARAVGPGPRPGDGVPVPVRGGARLPRHRQRHAPGRSGALSRCRRAHRRRSTTRRVCARSGGCGGDRHPAQGRPSLGGARAALAGAHDRHHRQSPPLRADARLPARRASEMPIWRGCTCRPGSISARERPRRSRSPCWGRW